MNAFKPTTHAYTEIGQSLPGHRNSQSALSLWVATEPSVFLGRWNNSVQASLKADRAGSRP
jgi:hypothetical protein